jgi:RNA recognition motif-containing protein
VAVYIGNLSYSVTREDLEEIFGDYGTVKSVQLPIDRETGRIRGFAFVQMETDEEEQAVIEAYDGAEWMGRDLKVSKAKPREDRRPSGGSGNSRGAVGGRGGRRDSF